MRKNFFSHPVIFFLFLLLSYFTSPVYAQFPEEWSQLAGNRCAENGVAKIQGFECIFTNITRILVPVAGICLFLMLIVGAFQLITAGGEAKALQKARSTLTYAIFGFIIFFGIWFILQLIKTITGVDVTLFKIPG